MTEKLKKRERKKRKLRKKIVGGRTVYMGGKQNY